MFSLFLRNLSNALLLFIVLLNDPRWFPAFIKTFGVFFHLSRENAIHIRCICNICMPLYVRECAHQCRFLCWCTYACTIIYELVYFMYTCVCKRMFHSFWLKVNSEKSAYGPKLTYIKHLNFIIMSNWSV